MYGNGEETRERYWEHFTMLPNSSDVDASGSRFRVVTVGTRGCRDTRRRMTTDALAMLNTVPFCARV